MKVIRLVFFHIYNSYYNDGNYQNDIPHLTAFGLVGCSFSIIFLVATFSVCQFFFHLELNMVLATIPFICMLMVFYFVLLHNKKYSAIYQEFKNSKWDTTPTKTFSWSVLFVAFIMAVTYAYYFNPGKD